MKIIEKKKFIVTGISVQAEWQELWTKMPEAWNGFFKSYKEIKNRKNNILIDISLHKKNGMYTQFLCVEVESRDYKSPENMTTIEIPEKKYIFYQHTGPLQAIAKSFGKIYDWAQEQNLNTTEFKLDIGYTPKSEEKNHKLYVEII